MRKGFAHEANMFRKQILKIELVYLLIIYYMFINNTNLNFTAKLD